MGMAIGTEHDNKMTRRLETLPGLVLLAMATPAVWAQDACEPAGDPALLRQAEQKTMLLERLVGNSEPVRRVEESDNEQALASIASARQSAAAARQLLADGCAGEAAARAADGIARASDAFRLAREGVASGEGEFTAMRQRTASFLDTLRAQPPEVQGIGADDFVGMERQLARADALAGESRYAEATRVLAPVADRLQRRLIAIYDRRTVYYEKVFAGPAEEYAYLLEQFQGYVLLLTSGEGTARLPHSSRARFDDAMTGAQARRTDAERMAAEGDYAAAIGAIGEALKSCEAALRLSGIYY